MSLTNRISFRMKAPVLKIIVGSNENGLRLDVFCTRKIEGYSRSHFTKLAAAGYIKLNDKSAKPSHKVKAGELFIIEMAAPPPIEAQSENIPLDIRYEDDYLLIVNKPSGMVSHPAAGNYSGTLINGLLYYLSNLKGFSDKIRPGLVHRLDKDTSGLLVIAKDEQTLALLQKMMKDRLIERQYKALVWGRMPNAEGTIDLPLGRSPSDRKKMRVYGTKNRESVTHYKVVKTYSIAELLTVKLQTGRTHQIRVHTSYFGNPVVGDSTYGGRSKAVIKFSGTNKRLALALLRELDSQALHAYSLALEHPVTKEQLSLTSDIPDDMQKAIAILESYN